MMTIIGCGNPNRSDDAVGVLVARRLAERLERHPLPEVQVFDAGTAGMEVMFSARGSDALVIIDACRSGSEPGSVFRVPGAELESEPRAGFSLHDFRWDHALYAGRRIFREAFPTDVDVWLVEAKTLELGLEPSPEVKSAADEVYRQVLERIAEYAVNRHRGDELDVRVARGCLTIEAPVFERYFRNAPAVAVVERDGRLVLLPLEDGYGGTLVKLKNRRGDRSVEIAEFMRARGFDEWSETSWRATWSTELGGLSIAPKPLESR